VNGRSAHPPPIAGEGQPAEGRQGEGPSGVGHHGSEPPPSQIPGHLRRQLATAPLPDRFAICPSPAEGGGWGAALPRPAAPFVSFATLLRRSGFAVAPEQTTAFLAAIDLLGPRSVGDIRRAAHATLAPPAERRAAFDALFDVHFLGAEGIGPEGAADRDDEVQVRDEGRGDQQPLFSDEINEAGQAAATAEALSARRFGSDAGDRETLRRLARAAPARLPRRRGYRLARSRQGRTFDLRRTLREAVRNDGDVVRLSRLKRKTRQRNLLILIDVSGSMKARTEAHLGLAHALTHAVERADRVEVFTFGTRLTRVTRALRLKNRDAALAAASAMVSDWDGGTRIGDALGAFLAVPRFGAYARGAFVVVLSDGLERGDPAAMRDAVARLARRAWRLSWLTPLAAGPDFRPETEALKAIGPFLDDLGDGSSVEAVCAHLLDRGRAA
jgi:hypothetical protein